MSPECIWAFDKIGFNNLSGGATAQYQQCGANREMTTVLVAICADGSTIPPAQIYKGKGYSRRWTDNELGLEYAKHFERMTREKANGCYRCLSVDGHVSHVSRAFLEYCHAHKIHVPCYVAHGTHIYQGLDVTAFGQERDKHLEKWAHLKTMTPELIKTAFRKTGLWPLDPSVITADMIAPSKATSTKVLTPVEPPTPIRIITELLVDAVQPVHGLEKLDDSQKGLADRRRSTWGHIIFFRGHHDPHPPPFLPYMDYQRSCA
ncbi:hypothetical protein K435DRAFT_818739 [Dendrothele bispora CBS 962.96]|uniref:DDE-1 domain-containing protein n=1 Tax=Dendrothele bispora (strain CBS 962.96) TaxID=1314807 RepID=A0A4S8M964_DENBC|nr:hypothetical protein K435DRAFT_818739 [Dendrothele bispora CBS 962.96]